MKATQTGSLNPLTSKYGKCRITFGKDYYGEETTSSLRTIVFDNLPDISDTKSTVYNNEGVIGRSLPLYTYSHSGDRNINIQMHFFVVDEADEWRNLHNLRLIQSAAYPQKGDGQLPYKPPQICKIRCGELLAAEGEPICAALQSYSVRFPTEVAWSEDNFCPYRFDVDTSWLVVYSSEDLPYSSRIIWEGR